jgi:hypothetical protein
MTILHSDLSLLLLFCVLYVLGVRASKNVYVLQTGKGVSAPAFNCSRFSGNNISECEHILTTNVYEVKYTFKEPTQNETHVVLHIYEQITHESASGGSSFFGFVESGGSAQEASPDTARTTHHRLACGADDHHDGSYTISCDISLITIDFRVEVWLEYLHHGAFVTPVHDSAGRRVVARLPLDSVIYSRNIVRVNVRNTARFGRSDEQCTAQKLHLDKGYWVSDTRGGWEWSPSKCSLQPYGASMACFRRQVDTRGVVMMGASHMRYMFDAVVGIFQQAVRAVSGNSVACSLTTLQLAGRHSTQVKLVPHCRASASGEEFCWLVIPFPLISPYS